MYFNYSKFSILYVYFICEAGILRVGLMWTQYPGDVSSITHVWCWQMVWRGWRGAAQDQTSQSRSGSLPWVDSNKQDLYWSSVWSNALKSMKCLSSVQMWSIQTSLAHRNDWYQVHYIWKFLFTFGNQTLIINLHFCVWLELKQKRSQYQGWNWKYQRSL